MGPIFLAYIPISILISEQCRRAASTLLFQIVPKMGIAFTIRHGVLFVPNRYGRCGIIKIFTDQDLVAIKLMLRKLCSKSEVLLVLLILLSFLKLPSGIQQSYLDCCHCKVPYVLIKCRDRCSCISLTIDFG